MAETGKKKKRRGLGFFVTLLFLVAAGATVFWFGWIQFDLDEGEYAVVYTKSHGYEDRVLSPGEFEWRWQALLPTNLTLHVFRPETRRSTVELSGDLPSGDFYAALVGEELDFRWSVRVRIDYRLDPSALPELVADGRIETDLEDMYAEFDARLQGMVGGLVAEDIAEASGTAPLELRGNLEESIDARTAAADPIFDIIGVTVEHLEYPDTVLYGEARRLALELMEARRAVLEEVEDTSLRRQDAQDNRIQLLEEYGRVLDAYPVLLDLFALEGRPGASLLPPENLE